MTTLTMFDPKSYESAVFLGYSQNSKAYIIINKHTSKVEESLNVTFDENPPPYKTSPLIDDDLDEEEEIKVSKNKNLENDIVDETLEVNEIINIKESRNHPLENVIGILNQRTLRLVAQGYNQQEGIDYDETYALVARLESIRILLAYACALDFKLFQMDVKIASLNGFINEEVSTEDKHSGSGGTLLRQNIMSKRRSSKRVTRIPLKFRDSVCTFTSKQSKHKIDDLVKNEKNRIDNENECSMDGLSENMDVNNEFANSCQGNVSVSEPLIDVTANIGNDNIPDNTYTNGRAEGKINFESYAKIVNSGSTKLSKELIYIPTGTNDNGDDVVIFEEELVKEGIQFKENVGRHGLAEIIAEGNDLRIFKFKNAEGMNYVLDQSLWMVNGKPLVSVRGISAFASRLGKPIMMDSTTAYMCHHGSGRGGYARILVEMDAKKDKSIPLNEVGNIEKEGKKDKGKVNIEGSKKECNVDRPPSLKNAWRVNAETMSNLKKSANKYVVLSTKEENYDHICDDDKITVDWNDGVIRDENDVMEVNDPAIVNLIAEELQGVWNVRGINNELKQKDAMHLIRDEKIQLCALIETHLKTKSIDKVGNRVTNQSILCYVETIPSKFKFYCSIIYASNNGIKRRNLWMDLVGHKNFVGQHPWALLGDFNVTLNVEEHSAGMSHRNMDMQEFYDTFNMLEVEDICSSGFHYTWTKSLKNPNCLVLKKLDRIIVNDEFIKLHQKAHGVFLPYGISDHSPSVLIIQDRLIEKLKKLKKPLRNLSWNNGNVHDKAKTLKEELKKNQEAIDKNPFDLEARIKAVQFKKFLGESNPVKHIDGNLSFNKISEEDATKMTSEVTFDEIKDVKFDVDTTKHLVQMVSLLNSLKKLGMLLRFLEEVLIKFSFPTKMIKWIMACISSAAFSICLNGEVHGYFKGGRGLRQWDPISPYLFYFGNGVLCKENRGSLKVVKKSLEEFSLVSGLNLNLRKCTIFFGSIKDRDRSDLLEILPFKCGKLPVRYLGVPLIAKRLSVLDYKALTDKVEERINCWRNKHLSYAGRIQLLASILSSMQIYWASVYLLPNSVVKYLDKLFKRFVWNSGDTAKGKAKVAWKIVCRPKEQGGLGIKPLKQWNEVFLIRKSIWDVNVDKSDSWGWKTMLMIRDSVKEHVWYKIRNDSHDHLFFKCDYALKVWKEMLKKTNNLQDKVQLMKVVDIISNAKNRSSVGMVINKLLLAATVYFLQQERNQRLFRSDSRTEEVICKVILEQVRHKLMSLKICLESASDRIITFDNIVQACQSDSVDLVNADAPPPLPSQTLTQQTPHTISIIKLPILKKGEYDIWAMKMEHYLAHTNYPIWEVIQRGNGPVSVSTDTNGLIKVLPPKTAEETLARERERKARTTLLMALPEDLLAKFHKITDAKEMWEAIKSRFGRNDESKKMQNCLQLDHEDLEQLDEFDLEEIDLKWQVAMISMRMKKFYKKTGHFARECRSKGNQDGRRRDAWNTRNKEKDNGRRSGKQEDSKALVTLDGEGVDWTSHSEDEQENYAFMACNSSGSDTEVTSCSKECKESYVKLKKLYDEQREQLGDASIEIQAYTQALKKVEAQLVAHQQSQLWYEEKIRFMKIDLDDKTDVLTYHKKLLAEAEKEKEDLKAKVEKWHNSSKNLNILLNSQMSARDKAGLGYGNQMNKSVLSYENEVFQSVFVSRISETENSHVNDRYAEGMHEVPPLMTGIYIPSGPDKEIDDSQFTYGLKQSKPSESNARSSDFNSCESNCSEETHESMPEPVVNKPNVVSQPKVWSDSPIIEEYESDSEDEHVSLPIKEQKIPSFADKHVKTPRQTVIEQNTCSQTPKPDKKNCSGLMSKKLGLGYGYTKKAFFVCGSFSHLIRDCDFHEKMMAKQAELINRTSKGSSQREIRPVWNNVQRMNHQNQFVPKAVLTETERSG
ncbi:ribonuclease H-like domain-containing protein [Tanacetum coccineum]|uniref:Ribonuclease H-like domain-containing protein n=1 Tax=Tanacetum coccineum TaxID=301880 RepID=A0ABQ5C2J1_9ASTR